MAGLSMDSPSKLDFNGTLEWTNDEVARPIVGIPDMPDEPVDDDEKHPSVASTIRKEEAHEPLLQENPHRFVLFPIKYHEVRDEQHATRLASNTRTLG